MAAITNVTVNDIQAVVNVKATAGVLHDVVIVNSTATSYYIQIFDLASGSVTLGTTTPDLQFYVALNSTCHWSPPEGMPFPVAISVGSSTTHNGGTTAAPGLCGYFFYS